MMVFRIFSAILFIRLLQLSATAKEVSFKCDLEESCSDGRTMVFIVLVSNFTTREEFIDMLNVPLKAIEHCSGKSTAHLYMPGEFGGPYALSDFRNYLEDLKLNFFDTSKHSATLSISDWPKVYDNDTSFFMNESFNLLNSASNGRLVYLLTDYISLNFTDETSAAYFHRRIFEEEIVFRVLTVVRTVHYSFTTVQADGTPTTESNGGTISTTQTPKIPIRQSPRNDFAFKHHHLLSESYSDITARKDDAIWTNNFAQADEIELLNICPLVDYTIEIIGAICFVVILTLVVIMVIFVLRHFQIKMQWRVKIAKFRLKTLKHQERIASIHNRNRRSDSAFEEEPRYVDLGFRSADVTLEIAPESLEIQFSQKLGSGAFSQVYRGHLQGTVPVAKILNSRHLELQFTNCTVAVKVLPEHSDHFARRDFHQEIALMKSLGYHSHLLTLLGCQSITSPICLVAEFCENGDLLHYVRKHKNEFLDETSSENHLNVLDLISIAWQISDGMAYLSSKDCIHRDLAARNILLDKSMTAKISDFGLCRFTDHLIYTTRGGRLPIKWMAIESLRNYEYSIKSDVWSFGVLLFEIFSLGDVPFRDVQPADMADHLASGNRLPQPQHCPDPMYNVMKLCWQEEAEERLTFGQLQTAIAAELQNSADSSDYVEVTEVNR